MIGTSDNASREAAPGHYPDGERFMGTSVKIIDLHYGHLMRDSEDSVRAKLDAYAAKGSSRSGDDATGMTGRSWRLRAERGWAGFTGEQGFPTLALRGLTGAGGSFRRARAG